MGEFKTRQGMLDCAVGRAGTHDLKNSHTAPSTAAIFDTYNAALFLTQIIWFRTSGLPRMCRDAENRTTISVAYLFALEGALRFFRTVMNILQLSKTASGSADSTNPGAVRWNTESRRMAMAACCRAHLGESRRPTRRVLTKAEVS
jgi:hypothetical protein